MSRRPSSMPGEALPAHDLEAERAVLGAAMLHPELVPTITLEPEQFFRIGHQRLWASIQELASVGAAIDWIVLRDMAQRGGYLEDLPGGKAYLTGLTEGLPKTTNVEYHARIVREKSDARILAETLGAAKSLIETDSVEPEHVLAEAEAVITALQNQVQRFRALDATGQLQAWYESVEQRERGPRIGLGLPGIDQVLEGVQPGEVLGIMARPGIGKTVLICHVTNSLIGLGHQCFSLEMPAAQIVERLARMCYDDTKYALRAKARTGTLDVTAYLQTFAQLLLDDTPKLSVAQMAARVRRSQATQPIVVVTVDHLGLIGGDDKLDAYARVSKQARELKEMAKRCRVAIILVIQVNREAGGDGSRELHLGSARDSGVIEEVCDYVITLRRLDRSTTLSEAERTRYKDVLFAKVLKHRHGIPMVDEIGYRIDFSSLRLIEEPALKPDENDLARLAKVGGRR